MNKKEAIESLKNGHSLKHISFADDEFIYMLRGSIYDEKDIEMKGFWIFRSIDDWDKDWSIHQEHYITAHSISQPIHVIGKPDVSELAIILSQKTGRSVAEIEHAIHQFQNIEIHKPNLSEEYIGVTLPQFRDVTPRNTGNNFTKKFLQKMRNNNLK